jgi:hypothetical protein
LIAVVGGEIKWAGSFDGLDAGCVFFGGCGVYFS